MQVMQSDPRYMEVFQVMTGIDLSAMGMGGGAPGAPPGAGMFGGPGGFGGPPPGAGPTPEERAEAKKRMEELEKERLEEKKR